MNLLRKELVEIARSEIGAREIGGNNRGHKIIQYQLATWLKPAPWPWCAAFVCWVIRKWLENPAVRESLSLQNDKLAETWRPKTASAFDFIRWAKDKELTILSRGTRSLAGDLVVFDFSHIGFVVRDQVDDLSQISTVEGNTNNLGQRESERGDGVWRKLRSTRHVRNFIRLIRPDN